MTMLRRYEIYSLDPRAAQDRVEAMARVMRDAKRYIPEVDHSAVGYNRSPAGVQFVWEHSYASPEAYHQYMVNPFHANIYDRYLLNDCPERIVTNNEFDVGLLGYSCETPVYFLPSGAARRLVFLRLRPGTETDFHALTVSTKAANPAMIQSVLSENTFGTRWLDGINEILDGTTYGHIWEQGYASIIDAELAGAPWLAHSGDMVERMIELWYTLETGYAYAG